MIGKWRDTAWKNKIIRFVFGGITPFNPAVSETKWSKIYETQDAIDAEIIVTMLREHQIDAVSMNKRDSSYLAFGMIEVYCQSENTIAALHLIQQQAK